MGPHKFAYSDPTDLGVDDTEQKNAVALKSYAPADEIGYSEPDWGNVLTDAWRVGYSKHLNSIKAALVEVIENNKNVKDYPVLSGPQLKGDK